MKVTSVSILPAKPNDNPTVRAYASVVFDNVFSVKNIKIIKGREKDFVAMPSEKRNDRYYDICHPIDMVFRSEMESAVMKVYKQYKEIQDVGNEKDQRSVE